MLFALLDENDGVGDSCRCMATFEVPEREKMFCERFNIPLPQIAPTERLRQLMSFRNERKLYRRKCDFSGKEIISAYRPQSIYKVFENSIWWGDQWDAMAYGRDFDFKRLFFEQFFELKKIVPREGTSIFNCENCDYNGHLRQSKNCYLNALGIRAEDCMYTYWTVDSKDCVDCLYVNYSTACYDSIHLNNCYGCVMLEEGSNCHDCYFSFQLRGCDHCMFCSNLANKSYYIFDKPCSKEHFEAEKSKYLSGSFVLFREACELWKELKSKAVYRFAHNLQCENCIGDHLVACKNCMFCFEGLNGEDCYNLTSFGNCKDIYNVYSAGWEPCEEIYYSAVVRGSYRSIFCNYIWFSSDLKYCDSCVSCEDCFGCVGLRHKKYCILNKQYSREEYGELVSRIIAMMCETMEWGQFFPQYSNPFAYNESPANNFFTIEKDEAVKLGFNWLDVDKQEFKLATIESIPDNVGDVSDDIVKEIFACELCGRNYRIVAPELKFYRRFGLPLPRQCLDCRHIRRFRTENSPRLFVQKCMQCGKEIKTVYAGLSVCCEECYLFAIS